MKNKKTSTLSIFAFVIFIIVVILGTFVYLKTPPVQKNISTTSVVKTEDILQTLQALTSPMVWSSPTIGSMTDAKGEEISGMLIQSKIIDKASNKLSSLLVSDSPLISTYGWADDPSGIADGMGQSIHTYKKIINDKEQKLIIRTGSGIYQVLLSN